MEYNYASNIYRHMVYKRGEGMGRLAYPQVHE
jgi:hypothetical protein